MAARSSSARIRATPIVNHHCSVCQRRIADVRNLQYCPLCKNIAVKYCSARCLTDDTAKHKTTCKPSPAIIQPIGAHSVAPQQHSNGGNSKQTAHDDRNPSQLSMAGRLDDQQLTRKRMLDAVGSSDIAVQQLTRKRMLDAVGSSDVAVQ